MAVMGHPYPAEKTEKQPAAKLGGTGVRRAGSSHAGRVRALNQDAFWVGDLPSGRVLAVVADGMGGHNTGEVASQKAVSVVRDELSRSKVYPPAAIARAVQAANGGIYLYASENAQHYGMGTTLTAVLLDDQVGLVAHVGDSRAYLVRGGVISQLTQDHSWVADRVRQGILSEEEARRHEWRNVITNALGSAPEIKLDLSHFGVEEGDKILLCSDGVTMLLGDETLADVVSKHPPEEAVARLLALADERGSPDNVTAVVLLVDRLEPQLKKYALPTTQPNSVALGATMSGVRKVEDAFPLIDAFSKLRRHPLYPYRFWILGCLYLVLLFVFFSLR